MVHIFKLETSSTLCKEFLGYSTWFWLYWDEQQRVDEYKTKVELGVGFKLEEAEATLVKSRPSLNCVKEFYAEIVKSWSRAHTSISQSHHHPYSPWMGCGGVVQAASMWRDAGHIKVSGLAGRGDKNQNLDTHYCQVESVIGAPPMRCRKICGSEEGVRGTEILMNTLSAQSQLQLQDELRDMLQILQTSNHPPPQTYEMLSHYCSLSCLSITPSTFHKQFDLQIQL
ncbi:hypothetical protein BJ165DRAFT_1580782 [Panaeolus papilionaceus]|nr:hypothetical protein BJ165DRAFT_1580782 [Panaeolus papilionaceus]